MAFLPKQTASPAEDRGSPPHRHKDRRAGSVGLRFAVHLGFPSLDNPLLAALAGSPDPVRHIECAAHLGFAAVFDPFSSSRLPIEQERIGRAAADHHLAMGSFLYLPFADLGRARWAAGDDDLSALVLDDVRQAIDIARRLGSRHIVVMALAESGIAPDEQARKMVDRLKRAGDLAAVAGMKILVEGVNRQRLPQMLLHGIAASAAVVAAAAHPAVQLVFDTGHAMANGEDPVGMFRAFGQLAAAVQFADGVARLELGAGDYDFAPFLALLQRQGYAGLCELEHRWSTDDPARQRAYLSRLQSLVGQD